MEKLTLYHGSTEGLIGSIRPDRSRLTCDFGQGFYMGVDSTQPKTLICGKECTHPTLYTLECDTTGLRVLRLDTDLDWALFVAFNRGLMSRHSQTRFYARYVEMRHTTDFIVGKIADDRIFQTVTQFFQGGLTASCLLEAVTCLNLGEQYCAVTEKACAAIKIIDVHAITGAEVEVWSERASRQHRIAAERTEEIIRRHRHQDGLYFDEILDKMSAEGMEVPK